MASRTVSPGGALLRSSRMFSVPPPLPRPSIPSESATLPHPIHLSITTPYASLQRGDWGFKRPLPLRSTTKTSTPLIRVEAVDTLEHITEFRSSADHALTLQKWLEMDIPLTVTSEAKVGGKANPFSDKNLQSVFEDEIDTTTDLAKGVDKFDTRWRFKGPWLAGENEGDFASYLKKDIRSKKIEFRQFLREELAASMTRKANAEHREASGGGDVLPAIKATEITDVQLAEYIKTLRKDVKSLYLQIRNFLDLAPVATDDKHLVEELELYTVAQKPRAFASEMQTLPVTSSPYAAGGPPKTHPSAGLSYSRTASRTFNHPEFGPQAHKTPVEARIVLPKQRNSTIPALGVGGFVTGVPEGDTTFQTAHFNHSRGPQRSIPGIVGVNPKEVGGGKTWVHPKSASIDANGKVVLVVSHGDEDAVAVKKGTTHLLEKRPQQVVAAGGFRTPGLERFSRGSERARGASYGLEMGGQRSKRRNPGSELDSLLG